MRAQRYLLLAALAAGIVAVAAGLSGFQRLAGVAAAVLLVLFILLPWTRERQAEKYRPGSGSG